MFKNKPLSAPIWSWRRLCVFSFFFILGSCIYFLGFDFNQLPESSDPLAAAKEFFSAALKPAFEDQNPSLPASAEPFLQRVFIGLLNTLRYAFIAMSMAVPAGFLLGITASRNWWPESLLSKKSHFSYFAKISLTLIYVTTRFTITLMRSIHELIWMLLFLAALGGDSTITACVALALPFTGTFAKVFSEIIDEQDNLNSKHITLAGGSHLQAFAGARFPQALPDLLSYTLYRLECSIRSSAVLGFLGVETIGLAIQQSYENNYYNEVWTELYLLIFTVMIFDVLGSSIRKRLNQSPVANSLPRSEELEDLQKSAPRWKLLPVVWILLLSAVVISWTFGESLFQYYSSLSRLERTQDFFQQLIPEPVRLSQNWESAIPWAKDLWVTSGKEALLNTVILASTALLLAVFFGYMLVPWASRNIASARPYAIDLSAQSFIKKFTWKMIGFSSRFVFLVARSIPEYILAFLLIGILGAHAWPLVFALALHNFGILGRLWSEISENHDHAVAKQQMVRGGSRLQSYICGILPTSFNRQLLFIFYRWETCVRESTILGMLSISSLGYYISIESSFLRYDRMLFFILLGTLTIFVSDLISITLRAKLKKS